MSADEMRQAAETLRRLAGKATPGVWKLWGMSVMADQDGTSSVDTAVDVAITRQRDEQGKPRTFDANYIACMDPRVGLALADLLDFATETARGCEGIGHVEPTRWPEPTRLAHDLARLINGGVA